MELMMYFYPRTKFSFGMLITSQEIILFLLNISDGLVSSKQIFFISVLSNRYNKFSLVIVLSNSKFNFSSKRFLF